MSSSTLYDAEMVLLSTAVTGLVLAAAIRRLGGARAGFAVGAPVAVGVAARLLAICVVAVIGIGPTLRGPDDLGFLQDARALADTGLDLGRWSPTPAHRLHELSFALQMKLTDAPELALRVTQVGIAMLGIVLILAAVHDLAGARAARLAAWALVLEPASIFFSSILHREPLLVLASGMIVLGGARIWTRSDPRGLALLGLGCAVAVATRPYAGWCLVAGALALVLHACLRRIRGRMRALLALGAIATVAVVAAPSAFALASQHSVLQILQQSQDANTDAAALRDGAGTNNLGLERVDFSTPVAVATNLPRRIRDLVLRPYPWQLQNTSQQLGASGTLIVYMALWMVVRYAVVNRRRIFALCAPLLYPSFVLLVAYALSVGNAGTGFRYRTHLVLLGLAVLVVLREHAQRQHLADGTTESAERTEQPTASRRERDGVRRPQHRPRREPAHS